MAQACFVAAPALENLAEKLAAEHKAWAVHRSLESVQCEWAYLLCEGADIESLKTLLARVRSQKLIIFCLNMAPELLTKAFPEAGLVAIEGSDLVAIEAGLHEWLGREDKRVERPKQALARHSLFVSHAVQDEAQIQPVVDELRQVFGLELFLCADSIATGEAWHEVILSRLRSCEMFVLLLSQHSKNSTFCAFEVGFAMARGLPIAVISLDGEAPPAFIQPYQMDCVVRTQARKPWLNEEQVLLDLVLNAIQR